MTVPPIGRGGGIAPQNCTIVSQCKSASAPCKIFLWRLQRLAFSVLFGPSDCSPPNGGGGLQGGGVRYLCAVGKLHIVNKGHQQACKVENPGAQG